MEDAVGTIFQFLKRREVERHGKLIFEFKGTAKTYWSFCVSQDCRGKDKEEFSCETLVFIRRELKFYGNRSVDRMIIFRQFWTIVPFIFMLDIDVAHSRHFWTRLAANAFERSNQTALAISRGSFSKTALGFLPRTNHDFNRTCRSHRTAQSPNCQPAKSDSSTSTIELTLT